MQTILKGGKPMMDQAKHRLRRRVLTAAAGVGAGAVAVTCGMAHALSGLAVNRKFPAYGKLLNVSGGKKDKNFRARRDAAAQEEKALSVSLENGAQAALTIIDQGTAAAANKFNGSHP